MTLVRETSGVLIKPAPQSRFNGEPRCPPLLIKSLWLTHRLWGGAPSDAAIRRHAQPTGGRREELGQGAKDVPAERSLPR